MSIRQFTLLAALIFAGMCGLAEWTGFIPLAPVAVTTGAALLGIAFQLEDRKLAKILQQLLDALHDDWIHHT